MTHLPEFQRNVGFGLLLGDAWLQKQPGAKTYRLRYEQGERHGDYFQHIASLYSPWITSQGVKPYIRLNAYGTHVTTWRLQTRSSSVFDVWSQAMYRDPLNPNKKNFHNFLWIPISNQKVLPIGLWMMVANPIMGKAMIDAMV